MLKSRVKKGNRGYLNSQKRIVLIQTIILFSISLLIFLVGFLYNKTKANLLTILAVLGLLPASKYLVSLIMYLRTPKYSTADFDLFEKEVNENNGLYELYFTSYQNNFPVNSIICKKDLIVGYTEFEKCDVKALEEHLAEILKQNGYKDINIKIFKDAAKYKERASQIISQPTSESISKLMLDISL